MNDSRSLFLSRWKELATAFLKLGATSYGGPAILGIIQTELQEKRGWLSKERFLEGLSLVNMLPGGAVMQLCIFIGYDRAGWRGGMLAGSCFILPPFCFMLALTILYAAYGALPFMRDVFYGLGPVVVGIFVVVAYRLGKAALTSTSQIVVAIVAAAMVQFTPIGIVGTLLLAGCAGVALHHSRIWGLGAMLGVAFLIGVWHWTGITMHGPTPDGAYGSGQPPGLWDIATFFFGVGAFTFGGGITVLAFIQEQVVNQLHWLTPQEFVDGIALGQLCPGPVLLLAAYVGYKLSGFPGAVVGQLAIYVPAFVLMLSILPALERFRAFGSIRAAMKTIGAGVIGVISVSLIDLLPHAAPDAFTAILLVLTVIAMLAFNVGTLPAMLGGATAGVGADFRPLQRLKELV